MTNNACVASQTNKGMDWKRRLKLHEIRDTFYFEACNFTLNPLQDFVLTYFKPEQKRGGGRTRQNKITVECFYNTFLKTLM